MTYTGPCPLYSHEQIDKARLPPEFPRVQYLGIVAYVFSQASIESCQNPDEIDPNAKKSIGIDPGLVLPTLPLWLHN